jgi:hypothetical protein
MDKRNQGQKPACAKFEFMDMLLDGPLVLMLASIGWRSAWPDSANSRFAPNFRLKALRFVAFQKL